MISAHKLIDRLNDLIENIGDYNEELQDKYEDIISNVPITDVFADDHNQYDILDQILDLVIKVRDKKLEITHYHWDDDSIGINFYDEKGYKKLVDLEKELKILTKKLEKEAAITEKEAEKIKEQERVTQEKAELERLQNKYKKS